MLNPKAMNRAMWMSFARWRLTSMAVAVAAGCSRESEAAVTSKPTTTPATIAAGPTATGSNFNVAMTADGCKAGEVCTVRIVLTASGGYHVNPDFPHKFTADTVDGVEYLGSSKNVYTKADFEKPIGEDETTGTMLGEVQACEGRNRRGQRPLQVRHLQRSDLPARRAAAHDQRRRSLT